MIQTEIKQRKTWMLNSQVAAIAISIVSILVLIVAFYFYEIDMHLGVIYIFSLPMVFILYLFVKLHDEENNKKGLSIYFSKLSIIDLVFIIFVIGANITVMFSVLSEVNPEQYVAYKENKEFIMKESEILKSMGHEVPDFEKIERDKILNVNENFKVKTCVLKIKEKIKNAQNKEQQQLDVLKGKSIKDTFGLKVN